VAAYTRLNPALVADGLKHLRRVDRSLKRVIDDVGEFRMTWARNHYQSLARAIVFQQISGHAARTIWNRLAALGAPDRISAAVFMRHTDEQLRGAGLSPQKLRYLRDLSARVLDGRLSLPRLSRLPDEVVIERLVEVTGVGVWTAQMFLMFSLARPDVFAPDDLGLRSGIRKLYGLSELPDRAACLTIAERWQPYRSIASWYLWRCLETKTPG
jgi:DNA-3-methyladenine glycosylase II